MSTARITLEIMSNGRIMSRIALAGGASVLVVMGALSGCSSTKEEPSSTTTPSSTTSSVVSPTEKAMTPGGDNSFSPTVHAPHPGGNCTRIVNGVCMR